MAVVHEDGITDHIRAREEEHFRRKDRELINRSCGRRMRMRERNARSNRKRASTIPACCRISGSSGSPPKRLRFFHWFRCSRSPGHEPASAPPSEP